jgi:murein DD-endopeptidase MepM/ murein hydrolase activator NlpD
LDISQYLIKSRFTELLLKKNAFGKNKFKEWIFHPGMLFGSKDKWWDKSARDKPHEGLDLCCYCNHSEKILRINEGTKIPAMFDGIVAGIIDDFLGKSIIIKHNISGSVLGAFCTIYGHVIPESGIDAGSIVKQGDLIAALAGIGKSKAKIFPHLHISLGYTSENIPYEKLDWAIISDPKNFTLLNPMQIINSYYRVIDYDNMVNGAFCK